MEHLKRMATLPTHKAVDGSPQHSTDLWTNVALQLPPDAEFFDDVQEKCMAAFDPVDVLCFAALRRRRNT